MAKKQEYYSVWRTRAYKREQTYCKYYKITLKSRLSATPQLSEPNVIITFNYLYICNVYLDEKCNFCQKIAV